jgi:serine protease Do
LGVTVQNVTKDLADQLGYRIGEGVVVTGVEPGSPAANADIQPGDLIESVNRQSISSVEDFEKMISRVKEDKVLLLVRRGEYSRFVVVPLGQ